MDLTEYARQRQAGQLPDPATADAPAAPAASPLQAYAEQTRRVAADAAGIVRERYKDYGLDDAAQAVRIAADLKEQSGADYPPDAFLGNGALERTLAGRKLSQDLHTSTSLASWAGENGINAIIADADRQNLNVIGGMIGGFNRRVDQMVVGAGPRMALSNANREIFAAKRAIADREKSYLEIMWEVGRDNQIEDRKKLFGVVPDFTGQARDFLAAPITAAGRYARSRLFGDNEEAIAAAQDRGARSANRMAALLAEVETNWGRSASAARALPELERIGKIEGFWPQFEALADYMAKDPAAMMAFTLETVGESAPMVLGAFAGYAVAGPVGGAVATGAASYGTSSLLELQEVAKEKGYDLSDPAQAQRLLADPAALQDVLATTDAYASVVGLFDAASAGLAGTRLASSAMGEVLLQSLAQMGAGGGGEAYGRFVSGRSMDAVEIVMEILAEIPGGAVDVGTAKVGVALHDQQNRKAVQRGVEADKAFFDALAAGSENSEAKAKVPEKFREAVDRIVGEGHGSTIYVDAGRVDSLFQSGDIDPPLFEAVTGYTLEQVQDAAARGEDIQIATADYAAKIIGTPLDQTLREHSRVDPSRLSAAEAKEQAETAEETRAEVDEAARAAEDGRLQFDAEIEAVRADTSARMEAAGFTREVAEKYATYDAAFYQTMSNRTGISPAALLRRFPPAILRVDGKVAEAPAEALQQGSDAFNRWYGNSTLRDAEGNPQVVYHGRQSDFEAFRPDRMVWASRGTELPSSYAEGRGAEGGNVMPLYLRAERPFDADALPKNATLDQFFATLENQAPVAPEDAARADELRQTIRKSVPPAPFLTFASQAFWQDSARLFGKEGERAIRELYALHGFDSIALTEGGEATIGVFRPEQAKSIWNNGAYDVNDPRVLNQTVPLMRGDETLAPYFPEGIGTGKGQTKPTVRDVAVAMQRRAERKRGAIVEGTDAKAVDKIARHLLDEILFEVEQAEVNPGASAVGWYTTKTQAALDRLGDAFPELTGDAAALTLPGPASVGGTREGARDLMTALLAFTSDGAKIRDNFARAVAVYAAWRDSAVLTADAAPGHIRGTLQGNLDRLSDLLARSKGNAGEVFRGYLLEEMTVKEMRAQARETGVDLGPAAKYAGDTMLPRSALTFGPKLGAFYANLMGATGYLTMDRWWTRTINRVRGRLVPQPSASGIERVRKLLIADGADPASVATAEQVIEATKPYRAAYEAKGFKNGTELEKAANTVWKAAFNELADAPQSASERTFMIAVAHRVRKLLENAGHPMTVADIQAVLWYYEKRLYGRMGARQSEDISYEEAAHAAITDYLEGRPADRGAGAPGDAAEAARGDDGEALADAFLNIDEAAGSLTDEQAAAEAESLREELDQGPVAAPPARPAMRDALPGLERTSPGRVPGVRETATAYMIDNGLPVRHQADYVTVDKARATEIARLYDELPAFPQTPEALAETMAAYEALADETIRQYHALTRLGFTFEWITGADPYASPREAIRDMQENGHLWVFPTSDGFGTLNDAVADHPLLRPTGIWIDGREAVVNDLFRIVHDVFGHGSEGAAFGARGEENAWQAHVRMFSPLAARAMTAETRGQNSWVNFGPHGEANRANPQNTVFADQKVGLLPHWVSEVGQAQDVPLGRDGLPITLRLDDFANLTPEALQQPGWFIITGMREAFGPQDDPRHGEANARLRATLLERGMPFTPVQGMYKGEPQGESYLVIGNEDVGLSLGRAFLQESILTNRGLEYSEGGPVAPHVPADTVVGPAALEQDFYSVMPDGTPWSMGLDFGASAAPDDTLYQSAPRMYRSALSDFVFAAKQDKAKGRDWLAIIGKAPGVKKAETVWTGLDDWLGERRDATVTKAEILAHLDDNAVELREITKAEDDPENEPRWREYTEDGGENYREFLLTVPKLHEAGPNAGAGAKPFVKDSHYSERNIVVTARTTDRGGNTLFIEEVQSDLASDWRKAGKSWKDAPDDNIAALEDEFVAAGQAWRDARGVLIEAMLGVAPEGTDRADVAQSVGAMARIRHNIANGMGAGRANLITAQIGMEVLPQLPNGVELWEAAYTPFANLQDIDARLKNIRPGMPYTPFEAEAAYELMAKRMLQRAAREGYQSLAWTPAYMQARRWDTAAQSVVERVEWEVEDGTRYATLTMAGGVEHSVEIDEAGRIVGGGMEPRDWAGQPLSALLGNAAEQVLTEPSGLIDGSRITFPSSGYAVAYERQFKGAIEKLTKKLGGRVTTRDDIMTGPKEDLLSMARRLTAEVRLGGADALAARFPEFATSIRMKYELAVAAQAADGPEAEFVRRMSYDAGFMAAYARPGEGEPVFGIEITDRMREALAEPFALFQEKRGSIVLPRAEGQAPTVELFAGRDLSTVLHEGGHYYLHILEQLATAADAPEQLRADWEALRGWWRSNADAIAAEVGVTPEHVHRYLDGEPMDADSARKVWRGLHEQFARGTEAYLLEGKAPSIGLRNLFSTFAAWLKTIYARTRGLDVNLTDEVRAVMDRLFATDAEIEAARLGGGALTPEAAKALGASEREIDALAKLAIEQQAEAQAAMLGVAGGAFRAQRRADYRRQRAQIASDASRAVRDKPVYRAIEWMARGRWVSDAEQPEGMVAMKLGERALAEGYETPQIEALRKLGVTAEEGFSPDDAADFFGFDSGDAMVRAMLSAPPMDRAIRQETRAAFNAAFGDDPQARAGGRATAMNGDKRGQQLDAELRVLTGLQPGAGRSITRRQAQAIAEQTIRRMPVRRAIRGDDFLAAERRAGQRVEQALVRKDIGGAIKAKREQLFQHLLYRESRKALELMEKAERKAKRLQSSGTRKNLAGEYLGAIDEVLETYDFRKISAKAERERGGLQTYLDMMAAEGRMGEVTIPDEVIRETKRIPYKALPVDRLAGVLQTLTNIEHTAREAQKLKTAGRERDIHEAVERITAEMDENLKDVPRQRAPSARSRLRRLVREYANIALTADTRLREYAGFKQGAAFDVIKRDIDDAGVWEAEELHKAGKVLDGFMRRYSRAERRAMGVKRAYPELNGQSFTKWDLIAAALNMGNEDNLNRLRGEGTQFPMSEAQIEFIKKQLDARDWKLVQDVWDFIGSYWPLIEARERRVTGVAPERVEASPVETPYGTLRGGYYPIKYDGELSGPVEAEQLQEQLAAMQAGRFGKAQTKNGHTKARTGSGGRVLALDISVLFRHVNDVIHDLAFQEPTANVWRILRRPEVIELFRRKGRDADHAMLEMWVQDVAMGSGVGGGFVGRLAMAMKGNFTMSRLALNASTVLLQLTGVTHSIAKIGPRFMAEGTVEYATHMASRIASVTEQSAFMRQRARMFQPDVREAQAIALRHGITGSTQNFMVTFAQWGLAPMQALQFYGVDMPTWLGAHRRALTEGLTGDDAVHYADRMVAQAQSGSALADRSAFERGSWARDTRFNGFARLWATLASYMIAKGNLAFEVTGRARKEGTLASYGGAATYLILMFVLEGLVLGALKGEVDWDDDDPEKDGPVAYSLRQGALSVLGTMPFIRDAASAMEGFDAGLYSTFIGTALRGVGAVGSMAYNQEVTESGLKSVSNALGLAIPIPSSQINRFIGAVNKEDASPMEYLLGVRK